MMEESMNTTRNVVRVTGTLIGALLLAGCVSGPNMTWLPAGGIYTDMVVPVQITGADGGAGGTAMGMKRGSATCKAVLMAIGWGDCSIQAAAASAGITNIRTVDWRYENYVGPVFYRYTVMVSGD
jgi:hypothetical protein